MRSVTSFAFSCLLGACGAVAHMPGPPSEPHEWTFPAGDVSLHARALGGQDGGPTIVAVHGGPGLSHHYMEGLDALADSRTRVVQYDQRGVGHSTAPFTEKYDLAAYVADLEAVRVALNTDKVILLGHSWGGLVVLAYAAQHAAHVSGLILVDSITAWSAELDPAQEKFQARKEQLRADGVIGEPVSAIGDDCTPGVRDVLPVYFADPHHPAARDLGKTTCHSNAGKQTRKAVGDYDLRADLRTLGGVSILIVMGGDDPFGTQLADQLAAELPPSTKVILPKCGHMPWIECAQPFFDAVRSFVDHQRG
jgi:proline iminopeptidase